MRGAHRSISGHPATLRRGLVLVLALLGVLCLLLRTGPPGAGRSLADEAPATAAPATTAGAGHGAGAAEPAPTPRRLTVPALALDTGRGTGLDALGLQADGTVQVPTDPSRVGWYGLGPPPGAVGSAVVLGHVDSVDGPAVFARLHELVPGDRILVTRSDGSVARFEVRTVSTYANDRFPAQQVYGSHGRRELNLVTCGGDYDADRGGYQANVVVNARQVSVRPAA